MDELVTAENVRNIHGILKSSVISMWRRSIRSNLGSVSDWRSLICRLIQLGADIHTATPFGPSNGSLLDEIMSIISHAFDSAQLGDEWLHILGMAGVDIDQYLKTENDFHKDKFCEFKGQKYCLRISLATKQVSWDPFVDRESPVAEVLYEFRF